MLDKFAQDPDAGANAWEQYTQGRGQARTMLNEADKVRPAMSSLMEDRVSNRLPVLNWFMSQGDVARADPRFAKYRQQLAEGRFTPGTSAGFYQRPKGWGWSNPLGVRNWFGGDDAKSTEQKLIGSRTMMDLMNMYRQNQINEQEFNRLSPVAMNKVMDPANRAAADAWRDYHRYQAGAARVLPDLNKQLSAPLNSYADIPMSAIDPRVESKRIAAGSTKTGAWDWLVNRGNKKFDVELEKSLENPTTAGTFFDRMRDRMEGKKPGFWQRLNPFNWGEQAYLNDPRSMAYMKQRMAKRLSARDTMARLFPQRGGRIGSLMKLMGPLGIGGAAAGITGLATKNPWIGGAGLAAMGLQGFNQYRRASDPRTWINSFATARTPQEQESQGKSRGFLTDISSLLHGKSASLQKFASFFSADGPGYRPPGQSYFNDQALKLLDAHFPIERGKDSIAKATNLTFVEKLRLMNAYDQTTAPEVGTTGRGLTTFRKVLPSLVGAGLGWAGAALAAPILGFDDKTKKRFGIGSAALGAILNNQHLTNGVF